ncbi:glycosyltransferase family 2 protein [Novosphingobium kaempferiae]|uniref:glycosyltransferase family 2 protein n=1 Tax=Novosphingobium kaempferiae TaxID=2896849 RepID=UPI001E5B1A84|nr:glycosyltransferase family 2 protein [Novosphingobium kaempferiae]
MAAPFVSVLMVARDAALFIDEAILSVRAQTFTDIEIVVVDDGSSDATAQLARAHAEVDERIRVLDGPCKGLSAVRNASLNAARGRFAAIVDSDDILDPHHLERLVAGQSRDGAHICAANMVEFEQDRDVIRTHIFAQGPTWQTARNIGPAEFVRRGMIGARDISLGYLKPLFDLTFLRRHAIVYDERLRIGEDFDLVLRAMLAGARYRFMPQATYCYRKHSGSTSHRLTSPDLRALLDATRAYSAHDGHLAEQLRARVENLEGARRQVEALDASRNGRLIEAIRLVAPHRDARRLMLSSLTESLLKRLGLFDAIRRQGRSFSPETALVDLPSAVLRPAQTAIPNG